MCARCRETSFDCEEAVRMASAAPNWRARRDAERWLTHDGMLCVGCLEGRLGRRLTHRDFMDVPINSIEATEGSSERLLDRLGYLQPASLSRRGR